MAAMSVTTLMESAHIVDEWGHLRCYPRCTDGLTLPSTYDQVRLARSQSFKSSLRNMESLRRASDADRDVPMLRYSDLPGTCELLPN